MYTVIQNGEQIGTSDTLVYIKCSDNGSYVQCGKNIADGFCVKLDKEFTLEDGSVVSEKVDTVFHLPNHSLKGTEPEAIIQQEDFGESITDVEAEMEEKALAFDIILGVSE